MKIFPAAAGTLRKLLEDRPVIANLSVRGRVCREPEVASSHSLLLAIAVSASRQGTGAWHRVAGEKIRVSVISRQKREPGKTIADDYPELASLAAYGDKVEASLFRAPFPAKSGGRAFDAVAFAFYGWKSNMTAAGLLAALLTLNQERSASSASPKAIS